MTRYINFLCLFPVLIYGSRELPKNNLAVQPTAQTAVPNNIINNRVLPCPLATLLAPILDAQQLIMGFVGEDIKYSTNLSYKKLFKDVEQVSQISHAYSLDGKYIALASKTRKRFNQSFDKVILWDRKKNEIVQEHKGVISPDISFSQDGTYLLIKNYWNYGFIIMPTVSFENGSFKNAIHYAADFSRHFDPNRLYSSKIEEVSFMDGSYSNCLLMHVKWTNATSNSTLFIYNYKQNIYQEITAPQCISFCFSGKVEQIAGWSANELWIWDMDRDKKITNIELKSYHNVRMAYSPNGLYFAVYSTPGLCSKNGQIEIYDTKQNYKKIATVPLELKHGVEKLIFSPDSSELFISSDSACFTSSFYLYSILESKIVYTHTFDNTQHIRNAAYSPDGAELSIELKDRMLIINRRQLQEVAQLKLDIA